MDTLAVAIADASRDEAEAVLALQKLAYHSEAKRYNDWTIPPLTETVEQWRDAWAASVILKATLAGRLVGSVRGRMLDGVCAIARLVVHPEFQGRGIGSRLLRAIEERFPEAERFELFTGDKSERNIRLYQRHGYRVTRKDQVSPTVVAVFLEKPGPGKERAGNGAASPE